MRVKGPFVPGLTRDLCPTLAPRPARGPGSRPGRGSFSINLVAPNYMHGAFCLHHGFTTLRGDLHRPDGKPCRTGRGASHGPVGPYGEIQDPHFGLVRATRGFRHKPATGTHHQTMAACVEKRADRRAQSELAGCHLAYFDVNRPRPGLDSGPLSKWQAWFGERSRVKPGTGLSIAIRSAQ